MFAAHLAAGLAAKRAAPSVPVWALLTAAFVPDITWIGLSVLGAESESNGMAFDGWSHSLLSISVLSIVFSLTFLRLGRRAVVVVALVGISHYLLDLIHPRPLTLYPHSSILIGPDLWQWGQLKAGFAMSNLWWLQAIIVTLLLIVYVKTEGPLKADRSLVAASCFFIAFLQLII